MEVRGSVRPKASGLSLAGTGVVGIIARASSEPLLVAMSPVHADIIAINSRFFTGSDISVPSMGAGNHANSNHLLGTEAFRSLFRDDFEDSATDVGRVDRDVAGVERDVVVAVLLATRTVDLELVALEVTGTLIAVILGASIFMALYSLSKAGRASTSISIAL